MAIRSYPWMDGFDYYATDRLTYKWESASNIHVSPTGGRRNSGCIVPTGAGYLVSPVFESWDTEAEVWVPATFISIAFAVYRQTSDAFLVIAESSGNTAEFEFEFTCSGRMGYRQSGGTWYYTDGIIPVAEWCHVFMYIETIGPWALIMARDSHGDMLIDDLIDGAPLGWVFADQRLFSTWRIESAVCGNWRIDDLYVQDADFKQASVAGDCRIDAIEMANDDPSSDYANWTFSDLPYFYYSINSLGKYVISNATTTAFACSTALLPHTPTAVFGVQSNVWANYVDADTAFMLTNSALQSTPINANATETGWTYSWADNAGDPWTVDSVNAATFGVMLNG